MNATAASIVVTAHELQDRLNKHLAAERKAVLRDGSRFVLIDLGKAKEVDIAALATQHGCKDQYEKLCGWPPG